MIDTHCHLDLPLFDLDREAVLARSRLAGVVEWVVPGIGIEHFPRLLALRGAGIHLALGLHPLFIPEQPWDALTQLAQWVERIKPLALGEIGLDYLAPATTFPAQLELLRGQLQLAKSHRLPVLLHVRKAHDPMLALLRQLNLPCGGIVHAFNGSLQQARQYGAMGFRLGFGGVVTQERASSIRAVAQQVGDDALVLESDAPDLPPTGHLGERNEPCHLPLVAATLAQLRQVSIAHIIEHTTLNARAVLGLPSQGAP